MTTFSDTHRQALTHHLARKRAERSEDLAWMADHGEIPTGAAERIGLDRPGLYHWCHKWNTAVWQRLLDNEARRNGEVA